MKEEPAYISRAVSRIARSSSRHSRAFALQIKGRDVTRCMDLCALALQQMESSVSEGAGVEPVKRRARKTMQKQSRDLQFHVAAASLTGEATGCAYSAARMRGNICCSRTMLLARSSPRRQNGNAPAL